jgi:hypothetical protein
MTAAVASGIVVTLTPFTYGGDALGDACEERFPMAHATRAATQALCRLFGEGG